MSEEWSFLCPVTSVPAEGMHQVTIAGAPEPFLVYRLDGVFYASDDMCTHAMVSLFGGEVADGQIYCPLHGGAFDIRTGAATEAPCRLRLRVYPVREEDGKVFAQLGLS